MSAVRDSAIFVVSYFGEPGSDELERLARDGKRPRKDYVEVARALDAEIVDSTYMIHRAKPLARFVATRIGMPAGQVLEAFLRRSHYRSICIWGDRIGLPLALLYKVARSRRDVVLMSAWVSRWKKAVFLRYLKVHSHLTAIVSYSSVQMAIAAEKLGVPKEKLYLGKQPVDDRFWCPSEVSPENLICSIGWEARDYRTLLAATAGMNLQVEVAVGIAGFASDEHDASRGVSSSRAGDHGTRLSSASRFNRLRGTYSYRLFRDWIRELEREGVPSDVKLSYQLNPLQLRSLYQRALFVVIPLHDVVSDCGVTALTEAMAMGKAVILTRTQGQVDILLDAVHGIYVPPGDPSSLRSAIEYLVAHPAEAQRMGRAGRALVEQDHRLDDYVRRVVEIVRGAAVGPPFRSGND